MEFKQSAAHNQRVERITTTHLVVGIDIAKNTHVARTVNFRGIEQGRGLAFENNHFGFSKLLNWIRDLQKKTGLSKEIVGLESTGHYWLNLADWLSEKGIEVVLVNPLTTKRNKENRDNSQSKNDAKDALVIADVVSRGYYSDYNKQEPLYRGLRVVVNEREYWADMRGNVMNRLVRWMDIYFPQFPKVFKYWEQPRSLATLKDFPLPADVLKHTAEDLVHAWKKRMQRAGGRTGLQKAQELLEAARLSVGAGYANEEARREISRLVEEYEGLTSRLQDIENELAALLAEIPKTVELFSSIKGLSSLYIAVLLANAGDLGRFTHGRQLLSMAGLNLAERMSGKKKGQVVISKRGRRQLRKYLYLAVMNLVAHHPSFKKWHRQNVEVRKMKKQRSVFKLIGKLARILVAMARTGEAFQEGRANPLTRAA
ncbi:IS110 family transposase [Paenibacillus thiaminolyticus]|uniref:IS110 family transposase n=1 Tax=Paenibacillus thiaminolyticus TaxID=49283 RepID=UPI003D295DDE